MTRLATALVLALFGIFLFIASAGAQFPQGQWIFDNIVNPDVDPLEISGGAVFPGIDTYIVLDGNDRENLMVYNIDRSSRTVASTSTIPVDPSTFGLSHVIRSANDTAHSCFSEDLGLFAVNSQNGTTWNKVPIDEFETYGSCETAVNNGDVFIGACDPNDDDFTIFQSQDNGLTWNQIQLIKGVLCPLDGGTRPTLNIIDGVPVVFYMTGIFADFAVDNSQDSGTRLVQTGELILQRGNSDPKIVDIDEPGDPLPVAESFPTKKLAFTGIEVTPYYHRTSNTIRLIVSEPLPGGAFIDRVIDLGPPAPFFPFFGLACVETGMGVVNVISPGRHFQYDSLTGEVFQVPRFPFMNGGTGPIGVSDFEDQNGGVELEFSALFPGSLGYGQFGRIVSRPIPTISEWGLIALSGVLMLVGAFYIRRKITA